MYRAEREQIRSELDKGISTGLIGSDGSVIVFGAGDYTREVIAYLRKSAIDTTYIIDNDMRKQGSYCRGVQIVSPELMQDDAFSSAVFVICSFFWREMQSQLHGLGISNDRMLIIVLRSFGESFWDNIRALYAGRKIYRHIVQKYPGCEVLICPYTGTGDIYLVGTFLERYLKREGIRNYVMLVVSKPCAMVADIFPIANIEQIDGPEACQKLMKYYMVCPDECKLTILNDSWADVYTNPVLSVRGLHGLDFSEMFRRFVFDFDHDVRPEHPVFVDKNDEIEQLANEYGLKEGRTVILSPYATTLADCPVKMWEDLANSLQKKGYVVCTNGIGEEEPAIKGTRRISFPLNIAPQFISWAGGFIGIRSGLCDVISGSSAKKVVLYDRSNLFFNCTAYEYFGLKIMGLSDDAIEIEYDNANMSGLAGEILEVFP